MKLIGKATISIVTCSLITGCGLLGSSTDNGQSEAFRLGYSQASELGFEKIDNEFSAYAFCTTIAQNIYSAGSELELEDYILGCMDYVLNQ
jgi:hypothetical protein